MLNKNFILLGLVAVVLVSACTADPETTQETGATIPDIKTTAGQAAVYSVPTNTLTGHTGSIVSLSWSPDGKKLVSESQDKTVKIWDAYTGKELKSLEGHAYVNIGNNVAWSPDGKYIASTGDVVRIWNANTGEKFKKLKDEYGNDAKAGSVAWSPDGKKLVGSTGEGLYVWDVSSDAKPAKIEFGGSVGLFKLPVALSADGKYIAAASSANSVSIYDSASRAEKKKIDFPKPQEISFSPDGKKLAILAVDYDKKDYHISYFDTGSGNEIDKIEFEYSNEQMVFSADWKNILVRDGVLDVRFGVLLEKPNATGKVYAWSPDGTRLALATFGGLKDKNEIQIIDLGHLKNLNIFGKFNNVSYIQFGPDKKQFAVGFADGAFKIFDRASGAELKKFSGNASAVTSIEFSPDGKYLITKERNVENARLWDISTGKELNSFKGSRFSWSPDSKKLAVKTGSLEITIFNPVTKEELRKLNFDETSSGPIAWSPDGKKIAIYAEETIVWNAETGEKIKKFSDPVLVSSLVWSPDSSKLAGTDYSGNIHILDIASGNELLTIPLNAKSLAWSPDGKKIVAGTYIEERGIILFDALTGTEIKSIKSPSLLGEYSLTPYILSWSSDGREISSGYFESDRGGFVLSWKV